MHEQSWLHLPQHNLALLLRVITGKLVLITPADSFTCLCCCVLLRAGCPPQVVEQAAVTQHFPEGTLFADKFPAKQMKALTFEQVGRHTTCMPPPCQNDSP